MTTYFVYAKFPQDWAWRVKGCYEGEGAEGQAEMKKAALWSEGAQVRLAISTKERAQ